MFTSHTVLNTKQFVYIHKPHYIVDRGTQLVCIHKPHYILENKFVCVQLEKTKALQHLKHSNTLSSHLSPTKCENTTASFIIWIWICHTELLVLRSNWSQQKETTEHKIEIKEEKVLK